jgi:Polyketide cyclase / dehydrase and lipid transport
MDRPRAHILKTSDPYLVGAEIEIAAPARVIFDILADPQKHALIDGSGTVQRPLSGPKRLYKGAKFGMAMRIKVPYRITNEVVSFEEDVEIAWRHMMKWEWRYELTPTDAGTLVREYFDGRPAKSKRWLQLTGALKANPVMIAKTLVRLKELAERP